HLPRVRIPVLHAQHALGEADVLADDEVFPAEALGAVVRPGAVLRDLRRNLAAGRGVKPDAFALGADEAEGHVVVGMTLWITSETCANTARTSSAPARVGSSASSASRLRRRSSLRLWSWLCSTASVVRSTTGCKALAWAAEYAPGSRLRSQRTPRLRSPSPRPSTIAERKPRPMPIPSPINPPPSSP